LELYSSKRPPPTAKKRGGATPLSREFGRTAEVTALKHYNGEKIQDQEDRCKLCEQI
jgi:hypothetical protein